MVNPSTGRNRARRVDMSTLDLRPRLRLALAHGFALCAFLLLTACTQTANLQTGLSDFEANEIVSVLTRSGIEAQKVPTKEGVTLTVKSSDISRATAAMQAAGLPRRSLSNLGQVFKKEGMISTPLEERARYIHGLAQELEFTLRQFENVISARVHVVLPERVAPGEPIQPSSAAVFIKYTPPFDDDTTIPRIRNLVASSIPGLASEDGRAKVSVVTDPIDVVAPKVEWSTLGPFGVEAGSVRALAITLTVLVILVLGGLVCAGFLFMPHWKQRRLKIAAAKNAAKRGNAEQAGGTTGVEAVPSGK